jgi:hypothetical protein
VGREEVDQINIISRWIAHHSDDSDRCFFNLPQALDQTDELNAFAERVAAIVCAPAPDIAEASDESDADEDFADREPAPDESDW